MLERWEEEARGSAWVHLHIRCVRLRFLCGLGEVVALSWVELVELKWCMMVAASSDVWRYWLAMVSWLAFVSVEVTQLEHCGDAGAGAIRVRSHGAVIGSASWEGSSFTVLAEVTVWS